MRLFRYVYTGLLLIFLFALRQLLLFVNPDVRFFIFRISLVKNTGISFGLLQSAPLLASLLSLPLIGALFYLLSGKHVDRPLVPPLVALAAGASSNLLERLFFGYVVDYIGVLSFPVFNAADVLISLSCLYILIRLVCYKDELYQKNHCAK